MKIEGMSDFIKPILFGLIMALITGYLTNLYIDYVSENIAKNIFIQLKAKGYLNDSRRNKTTVIK
jgi:hypothetical protein